jgi:hypothetical protein
MRGAPGMRPASRVDLLRASTHRNLCPFDITLVPEVGYLSTYLSTKLCVSQRTHRNVCSLDILEPKVRYLSTQQNMSASALTCVPPLTVAAGDIISRKLVDDAC